QVLVSRPDDERESRSLHGLTRTLINNDIIGVTEGYTKGLEVVGTGYRVAQKGSSIEFALGFSHPVLVDPPAGITLTVEGTNKVTVSGISKQAVGEAAANIRKIRKPEPDEGKGVRYAGEGVRRKAGKAGKSPWLSSPGPPPALVATLVFARRSAAPSPGRAWSSTALHVAYS